MNRRLFLLAAPILVAAPAAYASIARLLSEFGDEIGGAFVVLSPGSVRISRVPVEE